MTAALGNTAPGTPFATGVDSFVYPQFIGYALRAPNTQDIYNPGTRWQDNSVNPAVQYYTTGAGLWYEYPNSSFGVSSVTGTANQILATPTVGNVVLSLIGPYAPATYTAHGTLVGEGTGAIVAVAPGTAGQFYVSNGASADPSFQTATPQLIVTPVAGASQAMLSNHTYIANNASLTTFTLPATSSVGDVIQIVGSALNTGGWTVTYSTGQIIWGPAGSSTVTTGNAASATAAAQAMKIICVVANTTWVIVDNSGTITLT
ncbi:hypothetical protein UFOVP256_55 [uncultured Caudovirales phage]|uniref:Uncharacterized protein n=1 Tax=uncultured Caudovirales phage TaxID=2100421 RepID=A0A6J5LLJ7_9CAUD|nr:hypothetical protein UFOVP256_55 [uncultured Caudovirales phage]